MKLLLVTLLCSFSMLAADLPQHFTGVGLGFQQSPTPKASGWFDTCILTVPTLYACVATDYSNGTTSNRAEIHQKMFEFRSCIGFGTAGAGAATGATGGVGGAFDMGGVLACPIPEKLVRTKGLAAVFSGSWQKNNVVQAPDAGTAFRAFGQQTVWRFGVGKTF